MPPITCYYLIEPGRDVVKSFPRGSHCAMHVANVAECCFTMTRRSITPCTPEQVLFMLREDAIDFINLADPLFPAFSARIRLSVPALSLGDGMAIALASSPDIPVLTADRAFLKASDYARIELVR